MSITLGSRVHTEQTTAQFDRIPTYGEHTRCFCYADFDAAKRVYSMLDAGLAHARADRLELCRSEAWFTRHVETGEIRIAANACNLRWCPVCARARRNFTAHEVADWLRLVKNPKFITLTLKHSHAPLSFQIEHLYKYFQKLRRRSGFKKAIRGGIWFFHIKKSKSDSMWHPHLHCLVEGDYISKRYLQRLWCNITFGSFVVDIRAVRDPQKAAQESARYASSPGSLVDLSLEDACELVEAVHGRRICGTWGTGRGINLHPPKMDDKGKWETLGSWSNVLALKAYNKDAEAIYEAWKHGLVLPPGININYEQGLDEGLNRLDLSGYDLDEIYGSERGPP